MHRTLLCLILLGCATTQGEVTHSSDPSLVKLTHQERDRVKEDMFWTLLHGRIYRCWYGGIGPVCAEARIIHAPPPETGHVPQRALLPPPANKEALFPYELPVYQPPASPEKPAKKPKTQAETADPEYPDYTAK